MIEQFERAGVDLRAARLGSLKVLARAMGERVLDWRVYDLDADPGERRPLPLGACPAAADLAALLAGRYRIHVAAGPAGASATTRPPADVEERLRALGYLD